MCVVCVCSIELDIARAKQDVLEQTTKMLRKSLADCENQFMTVAEHLNNEVVYSFTTSFVNFYSVVNISFFNDYF